MKHLFSIIVVLCLVPAFANAQQMAPAVGGFGGYDYPSSSGGYSTPYPCYSSYYIGCEYLQKQLERKFETENEWGLFKIKSIPHEFALRTNIYGLRADGTQYYISGANTVNNKWEAEQPIKVGTQFIQFKYVGKDYNATVSWPVEIVPAHVGRDLGARRRLEITLTENHFNNADFILANLHRQKAENPDGSFTEYVRTKDGALLTDAQAKELEIERLKARLAELENK